MNLQQRITNILTSPKDEWATIAAETTDVITLYKEYIALLAAIPAVAGFIGMSVIGIPTFFVGTFRVGLVAGLVHMIVGYALALLSCYVAAVIIEKLAASFQSSGDLVQALKMVAYASTPVWLAGVLSIYPPLGMLILIAAIYSIYLFYLGLPRLMHTPQDKVIPYMVVSAVVIIVVSILAHYIAGAFTGVGTIGRY